MTIESLVAIDEINERAAVLSTPTALRTALRSTQSAKRLAAALAEGTITSEDVQAYVDQLMQGFKTGVHFADEPALCLFAVVLEDVDTSFAAEFLQSLAAAKVAELPLAARIAQQILQKRKDANHDQTKTNKTNGNGATRIEVHQQDMGGWVRVFTDRELRDHPDLPIYLSTALAEWLRDRPHLDLVSVLGVQCGGSTVELHAWFHDRRSAGNDVEILGRS